jgi:hypothetical protein
MGEDVGASDGVPFGGFISRRDGREAAIDDAGKFWPRGGEVGGSVLGDTVATRLKTMPEVDQLIGGSRPAEFAADVQQLRTLFERFTGQTRDFVWARHPLFPAMTETDWMRWAYLHMDHHFRQFGV